MKPFAAALLAATAIGFVACADRTAASGGPLQPLAYTTAYTCGDKAAEIGMAGDDTVLRVDGTDHVLSPVMSASGAKYAVEGAEPETAFWSKGDRGLLTIAGVEYPECIQTGGYTDRIEPAATAAPWKARGHEPFWNITFDKGEIMFVHELGAKTYATPMPSPEVIDGGKRYTAMPPVMTVTVLEKVCADSATGLPYPDTVTVSYGEQEFEGCGGDPQALLSGAEWVVEDINAGGVIDGARVTLAFEPETGRLSGRSGCNAYSADYSVGGEGIRLGPMVTTEMACNAALMMQERRLYDALALIDTYSFDKTGALVMTGAEESRVLARR